MVQGETHGDARDESGDRSATGRAASRPSSRLIVPFILLAIPPLIFYSVLLRTLVNIPNLDDYDAVIRFLNLVTDLHTAADKFSLLFSYQQGEFKLILLRALAWMQYEVTGHVNFKVLSLLGDGTVVLLAILLWKMFLPGHKDLARRMTLFAPAAWLLFQLQYWEALNFATPGLQHLAVLPFAFGAIYFLTRPRRWAYCAALAVLVLAVASDGNGLMVMPVGLLILLVSRRAGRILGWLAVSAGCIALYAYHYTTLPAPAGTSSSLVSIIFELKIPFVLGLIGSAASLSLFVVPAAFLGLAVCILLVYLGARGHIKRNPLIWYCLLFLILTVFGITGIRTDIAREQVLASRYAIYSALFLIFAWFAVVEEFLADRQVRLIDSGLYVGTILGVIVFALAMDFSGARAMHERHDALIAAMAAFERPTASDPTPSPAPAVKLRLDKDPAQSFNVRARRELIKSMQRGIYKPPRR